MKSAGRSPRDTNRRLAVVVGHTSCSRAVAQRRGGVLGRPSVVVLVRLRGAVQARLGVLRRFCGPKVRKEASAQAGDRLVLQVGRQALGAEFAAEAAALEAAERG